MGFVKYVMNIIFALTLLVIKFVIIVQKISIYVSPVENKLKMNKIYKILPFFIVEFLVRRFCEKVDNKYIAFDNIYILDDE